MSSGRSGGGGCTGARSRRGPADGCCTSGSGDASGSTDSTGPAASTSTASGNAGAGSRATLIVRVGVGADLAGLGSERTGAGIRARRVIAASRFGVRATVTRSSRRGARRPTRSASLRARRSNGLRSDRLARAGSTRALDDALRDTRSRTRGRPGCAPPAISFIPRWSRQTPRTMTPLRRGSGNGRRALGQESCQAASGSGMRAGPSQRAAGLETALSFPQATVLYLGHIHLELV